MYISLNWLKDFVKLPSSLKPATIAAELTNHTVEVEGLVNQAEKFANVVVGKVLEVKPHPNADRLRLAVVDVKKAKLHIVCGAPNLAVDQLVAVALVGAVLPNGSEIKAAEIRGEKSNGMICSEDELGLGAIHEGILVLKNNAKIGQPLAQYLKTDDVVLEIDNKSLSNRPDLLNHYGLARELAASLDLPLKPYDKFLTSKWEFLSAKDDKLEIKVEEQKLCPRYMAVKVDNITIQESPEWLKERLVAVGQRPINNIVDLANYVMLDCGQPLHAFDGDKIKKITVRRARADETIETLDDKERILDEADLVITDGKTPVAIAGVMGGKNSEINPATKTLVLEAANFAAGAVRKTSQKLGLRTESSVRFEKSLDPTLPAVAIFRFLTLLKKICPALKIASALIDINHADFSEKLVELNPAWLAAKIGQEIPRDFVISSLRRLGFKVADDKNNKDDQAEILKISIPSWRATKDIGAEEDIAEEILRLYGYDKITSQLPVLTLTVPEQNQERILARKIKNILALKFSLNEAYNYSFVGAEQLTKLNIDFFNYLKLVNSLSDVQTMLRQSLAPGLINNLKTNQAKSADFGFFEIGSVFFNAPGNWPKDQTSNETLPYQEKHLGLALAANDGDLFLRLKGIINSLLQILISYEVATEFSPITNAPGWTDKRAAAKINILGQELGVVALLSPEAAADINLKKPAVVAELNFNLLVSLMGNLPPFPFRELAKYPPVVRDIALVLDQKILYNDLQADLMAFNPLIKSAELFDVYHGSKLAVNQKSLAWHIVYQSEERTLTALEVDKIQTDLVAHLARKFSAKLRDF